MDDFGGNQYGLSRNHKDTKIWNALYKHLFLTIYFKGNLQHTTYMCVCVLLNMKMFLCITPNIANYADYIEKSVLISPREKNIILKESWKMKKKS